MGTMPIRKLIFSMSWPMMLSMLIQALYNMVDSYFVALVDAKSFLALSFIYPAQLLMISVCLGTGVGVNAMLSRRLGERREDEAKAVALNGLFVYAVTAIVFALLGLIIGPRFVGWFSDDPIVVEYGAQYLTIIMVASIGMCLQFACARILQGLGQPIGSMLIQGAGAVVNMILDPIFIISMDLGIVGAAVATCIGQFVGMFLGFILLARNKVLKLSLKGFRPAQSTIRDIYRIGFPAMMMNALSPIMNLGLNKILALTVVTSVMGDAGVFVLGAYFKLQSFVFMPVTGLNNGMTPVLSYNYGAKKRQRVQDGLKFSLQVSLGIMAVGTLIFMVFPIQLLSLFQTPPEMMEIGVFALRVISTSFIFGGVVFALSGVLQALDSPNQALLLGLTRQIVIVLPVSLLMAFVAPKLIWIAFPVAEIFSAVLAYIFYSKLRKERILTMPTQVPVD